MKLFKIVFGLMSFMIFTACITTLPQPTNPTEESATKTASIIKDCTGTYVRFDGNNADYMVCNPHLLNSFSSGTRATITFRSTGKCTMTPDPKCRMFHESKGNVTILKVE